MTFDERQKDEYEKLKGGIDYYKNTPFNGEIVEFTVKGSSKQ